MSGAEAREEDPGTSPDPVPPEGGPEEPETWDDPPAEAPAEPPTIQVRAGAGEITRMIHQTIRALGEGDPNLFQRAGQLCRVIREPTQREPYEIDRRVGSTIFTRPGTPRLSDATPTLLEHVDACSRWERFDARRGAPLEPGAKGGKRSGEWVATNPDPTVIKQVAARKEWPGIRPIQGIIETPCIAPSGRLIQAPGYDDETAHVLLPSVNIGTVADLPTQEHARAALRYLWIELACDFPFRGVGEPSRGPADEDLDPDRSLQYAKALAAPDAWVGVAQLLTLFARLAIQGAIPGGMFEAAARGSGKSLQMHTVAVVATGRPASVATFPTREGRPDEQELEKVIMGYAQQGARLVCFDNIKGLLTGATLERAMTSIETIDGRILGLTGQRSFPWFALFMFSGNNMTMSDDVADRVLLSRVESPREEPRRRPANTFRHPDLLRALRARRPRLVRAALVILRSYLAAKALNAPGIVERTRGSFEAWARIVPGAIEWAGGPNILDAFPEGGRGGDDEGEAHATILRLWRDDWQDQKASYVHEAIFKGESDREGGFVDAQLEELRSAVRSITKTREGSKPSAHVFSSRLFGLRGRIRDGAKIDAVKDKSTKTYTYRVTRMA